VVVGLAGRLGGWIPRTSLFSVERDRELRKFPRGPRTGLGAGPRQVTYSQNRAGC